MTYKIIAGPTQMRVERFAFKSEPIDIGDEHIAASNRQAHNFYYEYMHHACVEYIRLRWNVKCIEWSMLKNKVKQIVDNNPSLFFNGPSWVVSTVPWKQAKRSQWFSVGKKVRWLLKKEYTDGVRNRQEETSSVSTV